MRLWSESEIERFRQAPAEDRQWQEDAVHKKQSGTTAAKNKAEGG